MADPWIRVHANLADKPVVTRAMEALNVNAHEAMGALMQFWGAVSQHVQNGRVGDLSDAQLERWAGWTRKKGKFAAFIRATHLDSEGRVNEWDDYAGRLEQRRATERERLHKKRHGVAQHPPNNGAGVDQQSTNGVNGVAQQKTTLVPARAVRNDTKRNEVTTRSKDSRRTQRDEPSNGVEPPAGTPPATGWLAPIADVWNAANGPGSFNVIGGQAAGVLSKLRNAGHDPPTIATHLANYLEQTEPEFASITRFAQTFAQWEPKPLVDENGILTPETLARHR